MQNYLDDFVIKTYTADAKDKSVKDAAPHTLGMRIGDLYHRYFQAYSHESIPLYVRYYVTETLDRRKRQARVSFDRKKISYETMFRRITQIDESHLNDNQLLLLFNKVKEAITSSALDRVADRFVDLGIPLQEFREVFSAERDSYNQIMEDLDIEGKYDESDTRAIEREVRTSLYDIVPARSPMHAFIVSFFNDVFVECSLKIKSCTLYLKDPKFVRDAFFRKANEYAWNYKHERKPSQYAISYCRIMMDGNWGNRQYGESVTTLFLERFAKEVAHASTARYTNELSNFQKGKTQDNYRGDKLLDTIFDNFKAEYEFDDRGLISTGVRGEVFEALRSHLAYFLQMSPDRAADKWETSTVTEEDYGSYDVVTLKAADVVRDTFFDDKEPTQCVMIGVMANMFLEQVSMNPDFVFIACLENYILSETKRLNMMELHSNSHKAFRLSVERIRANRKRDNLRQYSAFEGREYMGFCWYQFILRHLKCSENLMTNGLGQIKNRVYYLRSEARNSRVRRFLGVSKKRYMLEHEYEIGRLAPTVTRTLEVLAINEIVKNDARAFLDYDTGSIGGRFSSATVRACRTVTTNTAAPMFSRRAACVPLKDKGLILRIGDKHDWMNMIGSTLSADAATRIIRKLRSDIMCGYSLIGCASTDTLGQQERAMLAARRYLNTEIKNLSMLNGLYFESFKAQYQPIEPYVDTPTAARALLTAAMRFTALQEDEYAIQQVEKISYAQMMRMIDPACKTSRYPDKATARNSSVFAAWKNHSIEYGANSQNHMLSYLMFASRYAVVSRIASISALAPTATPRHETARLISFPLLCDKLTSDVIYSYRLMNGERIPVKGVSQQSLLLSLPEEYGFITEKQKAENKRPTGYEIRIKAQCGLPENRSDLIKKAYGPEGGDGVYSDTPSIEFSRLVVTDKRVSLDGSVPALYTTEIRNAVCLQFSATTGRYAIVPTAVALDPACHGLRNEERAQYMEDHALISGVIKTERQPEWNEGARHYGWQFCYGNH